MLWGSVATEFPKAFAQQSPQLQDAQPSSMNSTVPFPVINDPNLEIQLVYRGLHSPTQMAFLGPNDILVNQKNDGKVVRIINCTLQPPVLDVSVANLVERGLLGLAVSKQQNGTTYVFLYYTQSREDGDDSKGKAPLGDRLYRYKLAGDSLVQPDSLFNVAANRGASHNSGVITIGPDHNVYFVVGDIAAHKTRAQNYHNGSVVDGTSTIMRLTVDGKSAGQILGIDEPLNKVYAYGIRNSFGLDFDPITGKLWDTENGPDHGDEINIVEPGFNSGWASIAGFPNATTNFDPNKDLVSCLYCGSSTGFFDTLINKYIFGVQDGKYSDPEFAWKRTVGPTAIKFLNSDKLGKQYENDIFVSDILPGNIYHFELNEKRDGLLLKGPLADKVSDTWDEMKGATLASGFQGVTDLEVGPDGYLYVLSYYRSESIYRIVPQGTPAPCS
jgi:glucose/arabinose dehydrogenase